MVFLRACEPTETRGFALAEAPSIRWRVGAPGSLL
jgi:hypothetical protein